MGIALKSLWNKISMDNWGILTSRELTLFMLLIGGLIAILIYFLSRIAEPPTKRILKTATASTTGAYYLYAQRYATALRRNGIELMIKQTEGSLENIRKLNDPDSGFDLAFVPSGVVQGTDSGAQPVALEILRAKGITPATVI